MKKRPLFFAITVLAGIASSLAILSLGAATVFAAPDAIRHVSTSGVDIGDCTGSP